MFHTSHLAHHFMENYRATFLTDSERNQTGILYDTRVTDSPDGNHTLTVTSACDRIAHAVINLKKTDLLIVDIGQQGFKSSALFGLINRALNNSKRLLFLVNSSSKNVSELQETYGENDKVDFFEKGSDSDPVDWKLLKNKLKDNLSYLSADSQNVT